MCAFGYWKYLLVMCRVVHEPFFLFATNRKLGMVITVLCAVVKIGRQKLFMRLRLLRRVRYGLETKKLLVFDILETLVCSITLFYIRRVKSYDMFDCHVSYW